MSCANHAKAHSVRLSDPSSSSAVGAPNVSACEEVRECIRSGTQTETSAEQSTHTHGTGRERKLDVKIRRSYHIINGAQCCVRSSSLTSGSSEDGEKRHPAAPHTPHPNSSVSSLTICKSTVLRIVSIYSMKYWRYYWYHEIEKYATRTRVQISDYQLGLQKHFSRSPFHGHRVYQLDLTSPSLQAKG
jgi:hypothetical protein